MADDAFWEAKKDNADKWYASTEPRGNTPAVGEIGPASPEGGALSAVTVAGAAGNPNKVLRATGHKTLQSHSPKRLQAHPGGPKLRSPGVKYPRTKFTMPPVRSSTAGKSSLPLRVLKSTVKLPDNFCYAASDLTEQMNQGSCGSCWAFSLAHMLADRACLATNGKVRTALSTRQIMECGDYINGVESTGCQGNDPYTVINSIQSRPINVMARDQYPRAYDGTDTDPKSCTLVDPSKGFSVSCKDAFMISEPVNEPGDAANLRNIENMKSHIFNEGPILCTFTCYNEFIDYDGLTIYEPGLDVDTAGAGGHAIEIIGWGKDPTSGTSYWVGRNSWDPNWPAKHKKCAGVDFFYFKMGSNVCNIEEYAVGCTPIIHNESKAPRNGDGAFKDAPVECRAGDAIHNVGLGGGIRPIHVVLVVAAVAAVYVAWEKREDIKKIFSKSS